MYTVNACINKSWAQILLSWLHNLIYFLSVFQGEKGESGMPGQDGKIGVKVCSIFNEMAGQTIAQTEFTLVLVRALVKLNKTKVFLS